MILRHLELHMHLCNAASDDASGIVEIYNHYVKTTTISFEEEAVTAEAMRLRIAEVQLAGLPWIVATVDGQIAGYAYATKWRVRHAYRFSVESSVYLDKAKSGLGLGSALYTELIDKLRDTGSHLVIGGIALPNDASVALHEKMGFEKVAHFAEVGRKFNRWIDVGYWQLKI